MAVCATKHGRRKNIETKCAGNEKKILIVTIFDFRYHSLVFRRANENWKTWSEGWDKFNGFFGIMKVQNENLISRFSIQNHFKAF